MLTTMGTSPKMVPSFTAGQCFENRVMCQSDVNLEQVMNAYLILKSTLMCV